MDVGRSIAAYAKCQFCCAPVSWLDTFTLIAATLFSFTSVCCKCVCGPHSGDNCVGRLFIIFYYFLCLFFGVFVKACLCFVLADARTHNVVIFT